MKDLDETKMILAIKIIRRGAGIMLLQEHHTERFLKKFENFDLTSMSTPYGANTQLKKIMVIQLLNLDMLRLLGV